MTVYAAPGQAGSIVEYRPRYDHWINGQYVKPTSGQYFENVTPVTGRVFCEVARGNAADIDLALDAAHEAFKTWGKTSATERANIMLRIADRISRNPRCRHSSSNRPLPLLRWRTSRSGRHPRRARPRHRGLPFPRATRRCRPDHPLELPNPDGRMEARSSNRCR